MRIPVTIAVALSAISVPLLAQDHLDNVIEHARKEFSVPGVAVAVAAFAPGGIWRLPLW